MPRVTREVEPPPRTLCIRSVSLRVRCQMGIESLPVGILSWLRFCALKSVDGPCASDCRLQISPKTALLSCQQSAFSHEAGSARALRRALSPTWNVRLYHSQLCLTAPAQALYALVDQQLHGPDPRGRSDSTAAVAELTDAFAAVPFVRGTQPQARNQHLIGYGGTYYSYAYAR